MKLGVSIGFFLLLSLFFVAGELVIPCSEDGDCRFFLDSENYSCVQKMCEKENVSESRYNAAPFEFWKEDAPGDLFLPQRSCAPAEECLQAPPDAQASWFVRFVHFLLYL